MAVLSKREGLARKVDTAAIEAESLGLTTATLILRMARLEIDRAEPDEVESMPANNSCSKPNLPGGRFRRHNLSVLAVSDRRCQRKWSITEPGRGNPAEVSLSSALEVFYSLRAKTMGCGSAAAFHSLISRG